MTASGLVQRFAVELARLGNPATGGPLVVALSGGLDSCVLLHLLRFRTQPRPELVAAHFDHGMRPESAQDADWIRGLCSAFEISFAVERAERVPGSEEAARVARYDFLESVRQRSGATHVLTGHHADDQAETVLFRVLRGTGIDGLRGIPATRSPGILRPLLGFWRTELEAYAGAVGLRWREDATNEHVGYARNVIRRQLLPEAEAGVAPGARRALVRLSKIAEENESAWAAILPELIDGLELDRASDPTSDSPVVSWSRPRAEALHPALRGRVLRRLAADVGFSLDEVATRRAVQFVSTSRSGTRLELGRGFELRNELNRLVLVRSGPLARDSPLQIFNLGPGSGDAVVGGRTFPVAWGDDHATSSGSVGAFPIEGLAFPLTVRGPEPGDRIRLRGRSRKVKKLLLEARIPSKMRERVPVLVDGSGRILWVPGVARTTDVTENRSERTWGIRIG